MKTLWYHFRVFRLFSRLYFRWYRESLENGFTPDTAPINAALEAKIEMFNHMRTNVLRIAKDAGIENPFAWVDSKAESQSK